MKMRVLVLVSAVICVAAFLGHAAVQVYTCNHLPASGSIAVDGDLSEPAWSTAAGVALVDVVSGAEPSWESEVKAVWDSTYLYVGFGVEDDAVWATMTEHDASLYQEEVVEVFVDPDGDGFYYYEFEWNCLGTQFDVKVSAEPGKQLPPGETEGFDLAWSAPDTRAAVVVRGTANDAGDADSGMTVEIAIAWSDLDRSTLSLPPKPGDSLRLNFYRIEQRGEGNSRETEYTAWSPTGEIQFHRPGSFGTLVIADTPNASGTRPLVRRTARYLHPAAGRIATFYDIRGVRVGSGTCPQRTGQWASGMYVERPAGPGETVLRILPLIQ